MVFSLEQVSFFSSEAFEEKGKKEVSFCVCMVSLVLTLDL